MDARRSRIVSVAIGVGVCALLALGFVAQAAESGNAAATGVVGARPEGRGLTGSWVIGGRSYEVGSLTKLDPSKEIAVDDCVRVEFTSADGVYYALKIEALEAGACK